MIARGDDLLNEMKSVYVPIQASLDYNEISCLEYAICK